MGEAPKDLSDREEASNLDQISGPAASDGAKLRFEVLPNDVMQPDRRPWRRLSLDDVVVRSILFSAFVLLTVLGGVAGLGRLLGLW